MDFDIVKSKIEGWLQPLIEEGKFFLVDIKISAGKRIEVYIDTDEGIHISACARTSRFLEQHLDGSGIVPDNYILEVSSPGMTNPLVIPRQYKKRIGRLMEVVKNDGTLIEAQLQAADDEKIKLKEVAPEMSKTKQKRAAKDPNTVELKEYVVKYEEIKRAVLKFDF